MADPKNWRRLETGLLVVFGGPVLGLLLGGVYSLPALWVTKEREPWLSLLLSGGLAVTVFGLGTVAHAPFASSAWIWAFTLGLLQVVRRLYGSVGHSLERFGLVHAVALVSTVVASVSSPAAE